MVSKNAVTKFWCSQRFIYATALDLPDGCEKYNMIENDITS